MRWLRKAYRKGASITALARIAGCCRQHASHIIHGYRRTKG